MKRGAVDFLIKPWNKEQLVAAIHNATSMKQQQKNAFKNRKRAVGAINPFTNGSPNIISQSPSMKKVLELLHTVAPTEANVLILGENGTGKELAALELHGNSLRKNEVFVHVDLGAIPETLFESELFGHVRGAFTGATEERTGWFETASGGTLFLDEIGNLSLPLQAKILTAIQNKQIIRIGSNRPVPVNIRLIAATNMPLYQMAESFQFRQDLLYRINTVEIKLPPLKERKEDIQPISDYYVKLFSEQYGKKGLKIGEEALKKLYGYHWPGNIRELAHALERAVILSKSSVLEPDDFDLKVKPATVMPMEEPNMRVEDYERKAINFALAKFNGNLSKAAEELGMARSTLYRKIAHFGHES